MRFNGCQCGWVVVWVLAWGLCTPLSAEMPGGFESESEGSAQVVACLGSARFDVAGQVHSVAWSADGRFLATSAQSGRGFGNTRISLWDAKTGLRVWQQNSSSPRPNAIAFSQDGKTVFETGRYGHSAFEVATGRPTDRVSPEVLLERKGTRICGGDPRQLNLEHGQKDKQLVTISIPGEKNSITSYQLSPDGRWLSTGSSDGQLTLWDVQDGKRIRDFDIPSKPVSAVDFTPDGKLLLAAGYLNGIHVFETETGKRRHLLSETARRPITFALGPKGKHLVTSEEYTREVQVWHLESGKLVRKIERPMDVVSSLAFSPDGAQVALAGREGFGYGRLGIWNVASGEEQLPGELAHSHPVAKLAFSPDGQLLATGSSDQTVRLWKVKSGVLFTKLQGDASHDLRFSPDGWVLGAAGRDGSYRLWEISSADLLVGQDRLLSSTSTEVESRFSRDLHKLAVGARDGKVHIFETANGKQRPVLEIFEKHEIGAVAFSKDGKWLAVGSGRARSREASQDQVVIWDLANQKKLRELTNPILANDRSRYERFESLEFAPDRNLLAARHSEQGLSLWDTVQGTRMHSVPGERAEPMTFSHDGKILLRLNAPRARLREAPSSKVELMETATGGIFQTIDTPHSIAAFALSPDGFLLAVALADSRQVLIWDLKPPSTKPPTQADLEKAVDLLRLQNANQGRDAMATLMAGGDQSVPVLAPHLKPIEKSPERDKKIQKLIQDLGDENFFTREKASKELSALGPPVVPVLKTELGKKPSPEVDRRIRVLLKNLNSPLKKFSGEALRRIRAIEVLEKIGTAPAEDVLKLVAKGPASSQEVNDARSALQRLQNLKAGR